MVLTGILLLAYMTIKVEHWAVGEKEGYKVRVIFNSVSGLDKKAQVRVAGVEVGRVEEIELLADKAEVWIQLQSEVRLHQDAEATIRAIGLMGEKYVELRGGSPHLPLIKSGDTIKAHEIEVDIDRLTSKLAMLAEDLSAVTGSIRKVLGGDKGQQALQRILDNADRLSSLLNEVVAENRNTLRQAMENINRLSLNLDLLVAENKEMVSGTMTKISLLAQTLTDVVQDNRQALATTIANLEKVSKTLEQQSPEVAQNLNRVLKNADEVLVENRENLKGGIEKLVVASNKLDTALSIVNDLGEKVKSGEGTIGKLFTDEEAYNNFSEGVKGIRDYFQRMSAFRTYLGIRSEYLVDEEETKSYVTLRLQPRDDRYFLLEVIDDPRGDASSTEDTTIDDDELKFSIQIAKRFYDLTIRGGVIESEGGFGLDYEMFQDQLKFSLESWDFDADDPHLKFTTTYYFYDQLFLNAGVDDIINDDRRSVFVGAGILFSDDDIKFLITSLPAVSF